MTTAETNARVALVFYMHVKSTVVASVVNVALYFISAVDEHNVVCHIFCVKYISNIISFHC